MPAVKLEENIYGILRNYCGDEKKMKYVASRAVEEFLSKQNGIGHYTKGGEIKNE